METKMILIAVGVLSLCAMLLFADNTKSAYALNTGSYSQSATAYQMETFTVNNINYVITCTNTASLSTLHTYKQTAFNTFTEVATLALNTNDGLCSATAGLSTISGTSPRYIWFNTWNGTTSTMALNRVAVSNTGGLSGRVLYSMATNAHLSNPVVVGSIVYAMCGTLTGTNGCSFGSSAGGMKAWTISNFPAVASLVVSTARATASAIDSGRICATSTDIWEGDVIGTSKRMSRYTIASNTFSFTSSTGIGATYGCTSDGTYVYFANNGDGDINRITISSNTVTSSWKSLTGVTAVAYNSQAGRLFAYSTSGTTFYSINTSTAGNVYTAPLSGGASASMPIRFGGNGTIYFLPTASVVLWSIYDGSTSADNEDNTTNIVNGIDCADPDNSYKLICNVGNAGAFPTATGNYIIGNATGGTGLLGLGCSLGWVDCTEDPNPATNGLGFILFLAGLFVIVGFFYYAIGSQAFEMPLFIWVLITLAWSAFCTITGIIDPTFLIISIVAIVALAVPQIKNKLSVGNTTFGSGSSA